ncbi:MAG: hypothetical protein PHP59_01315 [Methanofollis sp.]|uniref:hypothetical protein n=1 Tax=Methanofollis sp. TaxID=2052835 RepID=UPI0026345111|nr:hypothetical protein [Methanofollis sp.]MDD4253998.1 hypothetical protein [Methanofollis sp.]
MRTISLIFIATAVLLLVQAAAAAATLEIGEVGKDPDGSLTVSGTTNIAPGNELLVDIVSSGFGATAKEEAGGFYGTSGTVTVEAGDPYNTWSYTFEGLPPETYTITVEWVEGDATASGTFTITSETVSGVTTAATTAPPPATTTVPPATPTPTQASWGAAGVVLGLAAVFWIRRS